MDEALAREVRLGFGGDAEGVIEVLATYGIHPFHKEADRVQRAIVTLSDRDVDKLLHYVEVAMVDYRDVLYWAEYPPGSDEPETSEGLRSGLGLPPKK